mgnify:CR=1 FL=1
MSDQFIDYLLIVSGVLAWLIVAALLANFVGRAIEEMDGDDTSDMPPVERE